MRMLKGVDGEVLTIYEYPQDELIFIPRAKIIHDYLDVFMTFDIETTNIVYNGDTNAIMYIWQCCYGKINGDKYTYVGRTWLDFFNFITAIANHYRLFKKKKIVCYIHNASFEFQFIRSIFNITRMFAVNERVPVSFDIEDSIECRCSYKLSNMSLLKFTEEEKAQHGKLKGFDYSKERYPDSTLNDEELLYCVDDVLGLHESISHLLTVNNDTLGTIPLTSTGFVRRESRERVLSNPKNRYHFLDTALNATEYKYCKACARGGNTHANILYSGQLIGKETESDTVLYSDDKASSYPFEMLTGLYPMGKLIEERSHTIIPNCANILDIIFENIRLKKGNYIPYIPKSKCGYLPKQDITQHLYDNGRILRADKIRLNCTEIDFEIINSTYDYDNFIIINQYCSDYGYLHKEYRQFVYELFKGKCELKGKDEYFYAKFKNKINALFGMMLTDVTREEILYQSNNWGVELPNTMLQLHNYYKNAKSFLSYQHGIYVTANARKSLQESIDLVGIDCVYVDTDSNKHFNEYSDEFAELNKRIIERSERLGVKPVIIGNKTYNIGVWERDAEYSSFITHGAKKYAYRYSNSECNGKHKNELGITVAGLNKLKGKEYLEKRGGLKAFYPTRYEENGDVIEGIHFDELNSGRLQAIYNDTVQWKSVEYKGHVVELTSNVALVPSTYTLGITKEYNESMFVCRYGD